LGVCRDRLDEKFVPGEFEEEESEEKEEESE
jgi:hypothetical protein